MPGGGGLKRPRQAVAPQKKLEEEENETKNMHHLMHICQGIQTESATKDQPRSLG